MWSFPAVPLIVTFLPLHFIAYAWLASGTRRRPSAKRRARNGMRVRSMALLTPPPSAPGARPCIGQPPSRALDTRSPGQPPLPSRGVLYARSAMRGGIYVLNFYSAVFVDQLK